MEINHQTQGDARAVLWDVDGTMIDSSEYHWLSWRETLAAESFPLTRERFAASFGQRNDEILRDYFGESFTPSDIERVGGAKETLYRELVRTRGIQLLPGVEGWLRDLHSRGWRQAMASSAPRLNLEAILSALRLEEFFEAVVSAEDVTRGKPDPQVFLIAAQKLSVAPARSIVIEDAPAGVEAARRAGMRSVGVLTSHSRLEADLVVRTLDELPATAFDDLLLRAAGE